MNWTVIDDAELEALRARVRELMAEVMRLTRDHERARAEVVRKRIVLQHIVAYECRGEEDEGVYLQDIARSALEEAKS